MSEPLLRSLRRFFAATPGAQPTDCELLRRFARDRDEAAFELLVWRHAALVMHVCRQVLGDEQAAEDAFQATFLVLIRKARSILHSEALVGWLHRVALRVALRARGQRRPTTGVDLDGVVAPSSPSSLEDDVKRLIHEEIQRLPAKYRLPVISCFLEARTHEEAAVELGWPKGTVAGRLARAKELLCSRLARRGVTLSAAAVTVELTASAAQAAAWSRRVAVLLQGLRGLVINDPSSASLVAPGVVALAEGVLTTMFWSKMRWIAVAVLLLGATALTAGFWPGRGSGDPAVKELAQDEAKPAEAARGEEKPAAAADDPLREATNRAITRRKLKEIALAFHNMHDTYGYLTAPAICDKDGKPLLSWRVAILPYLGEDALYREFKLTEPWDGPHNKKLLAKMPKVFAPVPGSKAKEATTYYQTIVGPGAIFARHAMAPTGGGPFGGFGTSGGGAAGAGGTGPGGGDGAGGGGTGAAAGGEGGLGGTGSAAGSGALNMGGGGRPGIGGGSGAMGTPGGMMGGMGGPGMGPRWVNVTDGLSNTLLVVEAGVPVPWTKPEDVAFPPKGPLPPLGGQFARIFHVAMADGFVRSLPKDLDPATLRALITAAGGENVDLTKVDSATGGSAVRREAYDRLKNRNAQLKEESQVLREILQELRTEVDNLRWTMEQERLLALDPATAKIQRENSELEKVLKQSRDEARGLLEEIRKLKEEVKKRPGK